MPAERGSAGWYDQLYADARSTAAPVPWDHGEPTPYLVTWLREHFGADTARGRAAVVGCAYGDDAELVVSYGFDVTGFDVSPTVVGVAALCAPGGKILVIARCPGDEDPPGPPWLLQESEVRGVAAGGTLA